VDEDAVSAFFVSDSMTLLAASVSCGYKKTEVPPAQSGRSSAFQAVCGVGNLSRLGSHNFPQLPLQIVEVPLLCFDS